MFETEIECRGLPAVRLSQVANRLPVFPQSLMRVIGRTVIHDQNLAFLRRKILSESARNPFFDELTVVVGIDHDTEERGLHSRLFRVIAPWLALTVRVAIV